METKPETRLVQEAANGQLRRRVCATDAAHVLASPNGGKAIHETSLCRPLLQVRGPLPFRFVEPKLTGDEPMTVARRSYRVTLCWETRKEFDETLWTADALSGSTSSGSKSPRLARASRENQSMVRRTGSHIHRPHLNAVAFQLWKAPATRK
jgi:hypothetical protein